MAPVSVLAFDLDHFKSINDRYGHAVGDAVLQMFAKVARETLRASDVVGRLGGEEFVALLPSTLAEAAIAAERVRAALAAASFGPQRPARGRDGQHRGVIRAAPAGSGRFAHHPRRRCPLSRQGERTQPGRDRRRKCSNAPQARAPRSDPSRGQGRRKEEARREQRRPGKLHRLGNAAGRKKITPTHSLFA